MRFNSQVLPPSLEWNSVVDWTILAAKRTKTATKRTIKTLELRDTRSALHFVIRDIAELRPSRPRADGTDINTDNPISLASGRTLSRASLFWGLHYGGWFVWGTFVWAFELAQLGALGSALDNLLWVGCGSTLALALRSLFRRARSAGWSYMSLAVLALTACLLVAVVWYQVYLALLHSSSAWLVQLPNFGAHFTAVAADAAKLTWRIPFGHWMMFTFILLTWSSLYFGINAMLDLEAERARSVRALKLADGARLRALQSQLNPHFLFNALNGIATLVREGDRTKAADLVDTLSDFLRATLRKLDTPEIPVSEELEFVEQYLCIQRLRFGSSLRATVDADPETRDALVPTLILQPLVENAVRHGVLARARGGALSVSIRRCDDVLVITVEDDGPGLGEGGAHAYGVGFKNSAERLEALYGDAAHMSVGARLHGPGFAVIIFLPFRTAPGMPAIPAAPVAIAV
jgi:signal transduction histidine kinase